MGIVDSVLRSRLVHFVVAGGLLFAVAPRERRDRPVHIGVATIEHAWRTEQVHLGRLLTPGDKQRVVDDLVADEVLYREGRRLGIDGSDPVVRARIAESMRSELANAVPTVDLAEVAREAATLAASAPPRVRLDLWFVAKDRPDASRVAEALAASIGEGHPRSPDQPPLVEDVFYSEEVLARSAGLGVAKAAFETPVGTVSAPISSAWGLWIVRPVERRALAPGEVRGAAEQVVRQRKAAAEVERVVDRASADVVVDMPLGEPAYRRGSHATTGAM